MTDQNARGQIVLGAMNFGTTLDERRAWEILDAFVEQGGSWIDTADAYAFWNDPDGVGGRSEALIGRWLRARPGVEVRLSTKVGLAPVRPGDWPASAEGLSAAAIRAAVAGSLDRLGVAAVDLLWSHNDDRTVPQEETVGAFGELAAAGVARALGASNHAAWRVERARALAAGLGVPGYSAVQLRRSYVQPRPGAELPDDGHVIASDEQLDQAASGGLAVWGYTPLVNGAYVRADRPLPEAYDHPGTARRLAALVEVAAETGASANQLVLSWLMDSTPAVSPIVGVSRVEQLTEAMEANQLVLEDKQRDRLDAAS